MGERPSDCARVSTSLRDQEGGVQIKRISIPESNSGEIQESGINPEKTSSNSISSFGSRSEQISASRKPLFLDTTLCLKEPLEETMVTQGQESCLHTPVWGVEGFNISTSKEVEEELTTGKQHTRVFNGPDHVDENTNDTAMINTINFDDILLGGEVDHSTSTAPMDMIEEEVENENLMIENNTVPGQARLSSPTLILDQPTAQRAPAPARASLAPPAAPTTSSPPWRPSSTPESLEWIPSASLPLRPTLMPRSPTTPTRTLSPAQPLPTLLPSTPTPELGWDV